MSATKVLNKKLCRNKKIKKNNFEFTPTSNSSAGSKCMKGDNDSELTKSNFMPNLNLDFDDNLELEEISGQDNNSELMFPYDVNKRLSDQVQTLLRENAALQKSLVENEARLRGVQKYPPAMAMHGRASDLAASKIVELTKRVRELTADLEVAKLKCQNAVMSSIKPTSETTNEETNENLKEKNVDKTNELKELSDKLTNTNLKLCEYRNQCQQLKHELKISHKALANEVGDNVPLQNVLNGGTWRGRAQIICTLQQQVAELTEKLNNSDFKEKQINVNKSAIRQIEKDLKAENAKEIALYKDQLEEKQRKLDAFKARNKVLEIQVAELRGQVTILLEKTTHDDELISSLTVQLRVALEKNDQDANSKKEFQHRSLERELSLEKQRASQFQCALSDREDKIALLEERIRELQNKLERKTPEKVDSRSKSVEAPAVVGIFKLRNYFYQLVLLMMKYI
uniref:Coiled-coil domain-containing protein 13 n=1 Tax=Clastoptera arizonana TaxID=38151 RepID=A0A1B6CG51_9HEMI